MTNWPDASATARSSRSPLRMRSTVAPGAARPAMTASPPASIRARSKAGTDGLAAGAGGGPARSAAKLATLVSVEASAEGAFGARFGLEWLRHHADRAAFDRRSARNLRHSVDNGGDARRADQEGRRDCLADR